MTEDEQVAPELDEDGDAVVAMLVIWMTAAGRIKVRGPIDNKGVCYSMLLGGQDAIQEHHLAGAGRLVDPDAKVKRQPGLVLPFRQPGPRLT